MKRTLLLLVAAGLLVSTTLIVRRATHEPTKQFCAGGAFISTREVEIDGKLYALGHAGLDDALASRCSPIVGTVIQPNCLVWDRMSRDPIGKVGPFYTDGTCDGSGGGTRRPEAPPEVIHEMPQRRGPS